MKLFADAWTAHYKHWNAQMYTIYDSSLPLKQSTDKSIPLGVWDYNMTYNKCVDSLCYHEVALYPPSEQQRCSAAFG